MILDAQTLLNPFPVYRELRETSPVLWVDVMDSWLLFRYDDVKRAMEDVESFSSENPFKLPPGALPIHSMVFLDDPAHARLRRIAQPAFTPRRVATLEAKIATLAEELLNRMADMGGACDLVTAFSGPLPALVIAELLGVPTEDRDMFQRVAGDIVQIGIRGREHIAMAGMAELEEYYAKLVEEKRRKGDLGEDLTSDMIRAQDSGAELSNRELYATGHLFLVAGHETTTNLISNTVRCLHEAPEARTYLMEDLVARTPLIVEEVLRCRGPATGVPRIARRDLELHGVKIPAGTRVWPLAISANRDPRAFEDPERFIPDRNPKNILSFGRGIHKCIGEPLARLEAKVAIPMLYKRFPDLCVDADKPIVPTPSPLIHGCLSLPVRF